METEYGTSIPVTFLKPSQVTVYDAKGNEMEIPKCENCGYYKNQVIGLTHCAWICCNCVVECEKKQ